MVQPPLEVARAGHLNRAGAGSLSSEAQVGKPAWQAPPVQRAGGMIRSVQPVLGLARGRASLPVGRGTTSVVARHRPVARSVHSYGAGRGLPYAETRWHPLSQLDPTEYIQTGKLASWSAPRYMAAEMGESVPAMIMARPRRPECTSRSCSAWHQGGDITRRLRVAAGGCRYSGN